MSNYEFVETDDYAEVRYKGNVIGCVYAGDDEVRLSSELGRHMRVLLSNHDFNEYMTVNTTCERYPF